MVKPTCKYVPVASSKAVANADPATKKSQGNQAG